MGILVFCAAWLVVPRLVEAADPLPAVPLSPPPPVDARAVILLDADTGQVLYERDADRPMPMASTTKVMTALIAIERGRLDDVITTSQRARAVEGSSLYLAPGEQRTVEELLYGLMLQSGNDAAVALAEGLAGSVERFVQWMNGRAQELGLTQTRFADPHGLSSQDHYTTARDLAQLSRVAMQNQEFRKIVGTREYRLPWPEKNSERVLWNHNRFLWRYQGATGVKNGYTRAARGALVATAQRHGVELMAVVLGAHPTQMYNDVAGLMDWAFAHFEPVVLVRTGENVGTVSVKGGTAPAVRAVATHASRRLCPRGQPLPSVQRQLVPVDHLQAPVAAGQRVGTLVIRQGDREVDRVPVVSADAVARQEAIALVLHRLGRGPLLGGLAVAWLVVAIGLRWRRHVAARRRWRRRLTGMDIPWHAFRPRDPSAR